MIRSVRLPLPFLHSHSQTRRGRFRGPPPAEEEKISASASACSKQQFAIEDKAASAPAAGVVYPGPAGSAHDEVKCGSGVEEQLTTNNGARAPYVAALRSSDRKIVVACRWNYVIDALRTLEDDGIRTARSYQDRQQGRAC
jgi:hypothetical protein